MPGAGVKFANVSYTLPSGQLLLRNISLELAPGTITALLGRSGSGKTTLLRMVNGLVQPTEGQVTAADKNVASANLSELRRGIGYVIQETGLFPHMTVEKNVGLSLELAKRPKPEIAARVEQVLALAGLSYVELRQRYPWQLSGGQRQRVGLARALATDPATLLMDEPFGALDPLTRAEMQTMLRDLLAHVQKTVLLVTHDLDEALYLAQRVVFLSGGEVIADLLPNEVQFSRIPQVKDYVSAVHRMVKT
jgi:osmoprotectant transport system ATP-binding protein